MKIGITGTTSGIGKALKEYYPTVIEFNRINGNINNVELVYETFKNCDVFINNAYHEDCQLNLLSYFFNQWKHTNKKIITIGSSVCSYAPSRKGYEEYVNHKRKLRQVHLEKVQMKTDCKIYLINPGITDTPMVANRIEKKLTTNDVISMIDFVLNHKIYIPEIYFYAK
jgi:hypothetical protein